MLLVELASQLAAAAGGVAAAGTLQENKKHNEGELHDRKVRLKRDVAHHNEVTGLIHQSSCARGDPIQCLMCGVAFLRSPDST